MQGSAADLRYAKRKEIVLNASYKATCESYLPINRGELDLFELKSNRATKIMINLFLEVSILVFVHTALFEVCDYLFVYFYVYLLCKFEYLHYP